MLSIVVSICWVHVICIIILHFVSFCGSFFGFRHEQVHRRDRQAKQAFRARHMKKNGLTIALTRPAVLANTGRVRRGGWEMENRELTRSVSASLKGVSQHKCFQKPTRPGVLPDTASVGLGTWFSNFLLFLARLIPEGILDFYARKIVIRNYWQWIWKWREGLFTR